MKKLNIDLIKAILSTDFLFLDAKKLKDLKLIYLTSNQNFNALDIIELNFRIKQYIRVLQFVKKDRSLINILISNKQYFKTLKVYFSKNRQNLQNSVDITDVFLKNMQKPDYSNFYLLLNIKNNSQNHFFSYEINSHLSKSNFGAYKILNDLNSFKKLIFVIALLQNVLKSLN